MKNAAIYAIFALNNLLLAKLLGKHWFSLVLYVLAIVLALAAVGSVITREVKE